MQSIAGNVKVTRSPSLTNFIFDFAKIHWTRMAKQNAPKIIPAKEDEDIVGVSIVISRWIGFN